VQRTIPTPKDGVGVVDVLLSDSASIGEAVIAEVTSKKAMAVRQRWTTGRRRDRPERLLSVNFIDSASQFSRTIHLT
jgi:hypothetical protein